MKSKRIALLLAILAAACVQAQEQLVPLKGNSRLMQAWPRQQQVQARQNTPQGAQSTTAQFLPFADDFSYEGPYPDPNRWVNSTSVFVNYTKATKPITIGVATFDGLKANGFPYNPAASTGSNDSDTLTSIPLRLDSMNGTNIIPTDSVRLRFYYQPRGMWEKPESGDELALDFYNPSTSTWTNVWLKSGFNPSDSLFRRVMIAITDTAYLKNGFQFRFRNKSSLSGDVDHWHLDAIYVDKNLDPKKDTIEPEISFSYDLRSLLKNYSQMPFNQFTGASDMQTNFSVFYNLRNNYTTGVNLTTYYEIRDNAGAIMAQNTNGTNNVPTFGTSGYCSDPSLVNPSLNGYVYNNGVPLADTTSYLLKFYAANISDNVHSNDTIYYRQKFDNYFAYDDGSAEAGYGFAASGGVVAVRYKLNVPDTLRAVDVYFDPVINVSQLQNAGIKIRVWADNNGLPGALYPDSALWALPVFSQNGFDVFQRYQLVDTIVFNTAATFYVGIEQQLNLSLNIGYDLNNDSHTNVLFNVGGGWNVSSFKGSLMIRPVFGDSSRAVGIAENHDPDNNRVLIFPNPASDYFTVSTKEELSSVQVCDMPGKVLLEEKQATISTASLPAGLYLVKTTTRSGYCNTQKLLIAR
jgi:hypothetical protein